MTCFSSITIYTSKLVYIYTYLKYNRWFVSGSDSLLTVLVHKIVVELPSVFLSHCYDCPMCGPDFPTILVVDHEFIKWARYCEQLCKFMLWWDVTRKKKCMLCIRPVLWTRLVLYHWNNNPQIHTSRYFLIPSQLLFPLVHPYLADRKTISKFAGAGLNWPCIEPWPTTLYASTVPYTPPMGVIL